MGFPADIAASREPRALAATLQVIVGTIHSVKGGQADVGYLFPYLSQAGEAHGGAGLSDPAVLRGCDTCL